MSAFLMTALRSAILVDFLPSSRRGTGFPSISQTLQGQLKSELIAVNWRGGGGEREGKVLVVVLSPCARSGSGKVVVVERDCE